jgi:hypothetical protein
VKLVLRIVLRIVLQSKVLPLRHFLVRGFECKSEPRGFLLIRNNICALILLQSEHPGITKMKQLKK